jgi:FKBP-type peptidyl-prolyl cis-trans isomerase FklB
MIVRRSLPAVAVAVVVVIAGVLVACNSKVKKSASGSTSDMAQVAGGELAEDDLLGYGVGWYLGAEVKFGLAVDGVDADIDQLVEGFTDGLKGDKPDIDQKEFDRILHATHVNMQQRMVARFLEDDQQFKDMYEKNLERSKAYHDAYGNDSGTITLPSGLQYTVIEKGDGAIPQETDTVVVTGKGQLIDGPIFADVENYELNVWTCTDGGREILTMMPVGSTWHVAIPPDLAYGGGGGPPNIGPNETLLMRISLLDIKEDTE